MVDLVLDNGSVVTMDPARQILDNHSVAVDRGRIVLIASAAEMRGKFPEATMIDCTDKAILPGLIDLHGYLGASIIKSLTYGLSAVASRDVMETVMSRLIDPELWAVEARLCALDRLKFGTTFQFSMMGGNGTRTNVPDYARLAAKELAGAGMRGRIGVGPARPPWPRTYTTWDGDSPTDADVPFEQVIETCDELLSSPAEPSGKVTFGLALSRFGNRNPHDPVWSPEREVWVWKQAEAMQTLMDKHKAPFWTHAYGNAIEFAHDNDLGLLGPNTILSHCTDLPPRAIEILAETGTSVGHQPRIGRVIEHDCPVIELLEAGVTVGLGTDTPSTNAADLFRDMRAAVLLQRVRFRNPGAMPLGVALEMATIGGAKALGLDHEIGSIELGKKADLITVDLHQPHLWPIEHVVLRVVGNAGGKDVTDVVIDGQIVMRDRKVLTIDEEAVLQESRTMFDRLVARGGYQDRSALPDSIWKLPARPKDHHEGPT